jgi:hypothetical protein
VEGWEIYGPALRDKLAIHGNVTWKTAKGAQYLVRYYRDDMGVLVNKSLGRRSPETEAIFEEFRKRRETARRTVAEGEASMALVGRLAKAHGLARMPAKHAEIVRAFWREPVMISLCLSNLTCLSSGYWPNAPSRSSRLVWNDTSYPGLMARSTTAFSWTAWSFTSLLGRARPLEQLPSSDGV